MPDDPRSEIPLGEHLQRTIDLLARAERFRHVAEAKANMGLHPGDPSQLARDKHFFDLWAGPMVPLAESQGIDSGGLDRFIRTGNPTHVESAFRVLRQLQGWAIRLSVQSPAKPPPRNVKISRDEANVKARAYLRAHPKATARELAAGIGCSTGLISKLTAWKAVKEQRDKKRLPKKNKAVRLTEAMQRELGIEDANLARLLADQVLDSEPSPLSPSSRSVRSFGK
jgi:hypothetical protein